MFNCLKLVVLAFSLSACMQLGPQEANIQPMTAMPDGEKAPVPDAFNSFCSRHPEECALPTSSDMLKALKDAHQETTALVIPEEEQGTDVWQSLTTAGTGDCEDFALTMRRILRSRFPQYSAAFRITTAYTEQQDYHAVLSIETTQGTIVCDIRYSECAPWETFPYEWRLREVAGASYWQELGPMRPTRQLATAASSGKR